MSKRNLVGVLIIICSLVLISGCISQGTNEKLLIELNLSQKVWNSNEFNYYNITIPDGTKSIRIEYQSLAPEFTTMMMGQDLSTYAAFSVNAFNVVPDAGQESSNYWKNQVDSKKVSLKNTALVDGNITFKRSDIKGLIIACRNVKGKVKVFVTT